MRDLVLLSGSTQVSQDHRILRIAASMGVSTRFAAACKESFAGELRSHTPCLAMSAETLSMLHGAFGSAVDIRHLIGGSCTELLIFGCNGSQEQLRALEWLTAGAICGISHLEHPEVLFSFARDARTFSRQFAGLEFLRKSTEPQPVFDLRNSCAISKVILSANHRPQFVRIDNGPLKVFLLAGSALPDLNEPLSHEHELRNYYDQLIPVLIFLRHCFGERCWHGPRPTARLTIDDPLLRERYGFLDVGVLRKSMERNHFGTSIGFVPWNHWRTSKRGAGLVLGQNSNLSICIHGCDHTNKEFGLHPPELLQKRARLAMQRMELQKKRAGVEFEPVMIFPQGLFSKAAIPALFANRFVAAVNSTCFPVDGRPGDLTIGDLLRPALTRYNGFPIFQRRYPRCLIDFAFDLFIGKPALFVEHHEYFREGIAPLEQFVAALHEIEPDLTWPSLTSQLTQSCRIRNLADDSSDVQFFTRNFQLIHRKADGYRYLLSKHEPDATVIQAVHVNGASVPFSCENCFLKFDVKAEYPGQVLNCEVVYREQPRTQTSGFGIAHNMGVLLRRGLSELRDNTLVRHNGLLRFSRGVARELKVTGDS